MAGIATVHQIEEVIDSMALTGIFSGTLSAAVLKLMGNDAADDGIQEQ